MADPDMRPEWRVVQAYPDYEVSSAGVIRRRVAHHRMPAAIPAGAVVSQWEIKRPYRRKDGSTYWRRYLCVSLSRRTESRTSTSNVLVNRVVCEAFHGPAPSPRHQAAHGNGHSSDNSAGNLRWATPEENQADRNDHGTDTRGSKHHAAKLRETDVVAIIAALASGESDPAVAARFGLAAVTVLGIRRGKSWRHVSRPDGFHQAFNRSRNTTRDQAERIIAMLNNGRSQAEIAAAVGVSVRPVKDVKAGRLFPDLPRAYPKRASPGSQQKGAQISALLPAATRR